MVKKLFVTIFLVMSMILLAACGSNSLGEKSTPGEKVNLLEGVSLELDREVLATEGEEFKLRVINNSEEEITFGAPYELEYFEEGSWYVVKPSEELAFIMVAYILKPDEVKTEIINLEFYEPLAPGRYRVLKYIDEEPLTAEFAVLAE